MTSQSYFAVIFCVYGRIFYGRALHAIFNSKRCDERVPDLRGGADGDGVSPTSNGRLDVHTFPIPVQRLPFVVL